MLPILAILTTHHCVCAVVCCPLCSPMSLGTHKSDVMMYKITLKLANNSLCLLKKGIEINNKFM